MCSKLFTPSSSSGATEGRRSKLFSPSKKEDGQPDIQSQHPYLYQLAKMISSHPDLSKAMNQAGQDVEEHINRPIQQSGLPIAAEHTLGLPYKIAEYLSGQSPHASMEGVNPYVAQGAKGIGQGLSFLTGGALAKSIREGVAFNKASKLSESQREYANTNESLKEQKALASHNLQSNDPYRLSLISEDKGISLKDALKRAQELSGDRVGPNQPSDILSEHANQAVTNAKKAVSEFGGEGQNFAKRISDAFMTELRGEKNPETGFRKNGFEQSIGNRFTTLSNKLRKQNVEITETPDMKKLLTDVKAQLPELSDEAHQQITEKWSQELLTNKKVNAADFLESYRGYKQELRNLNDKYYGASIADQKAMRPEIKQLKAQISTMRKVMDDQLGGHYLSELKNIDKQYATLVAPLSKNELVKAMRNSDITSDPLQFLSLDKPGNKTLRMIMEKNPEIQRLVFGQKFASNPEKLLKPNEVVDELAKMNPKVKELVEDLIHHTKELEPRLKFAEEQKELEELSKDIPRLKKEIKMADEYSKNIKKTLEAKNLSKEKVKQLEAKLAKSKKRWKVLTDLLKLETYVRVFK